MSSRWARLAERRATALLGALQTPSARVLDALGGFPLEAASGAAPCDVVIDPARPEQPDDHGARLRAMIADCAPDGTLALVACGGPAQPASPCGPRSLGATRAILDAHGFTVALLPFDVLGPCAPLRLGLGVRRERVLAELDAHLAASSVRRAARLVEAHLVAGLAPEETGRVLVVGTRGRVPLLPVPDRAVFAAGMLPLLHDDAVMRWLAFVDTELLSPVGAGIGLLAAMRDVDGTAAQTLLQARGRWWARDLEVQRLVEASAHRLACRTIAALDDPVAATLEYELVSAMNALANRWLADELPPCNVR
ncbi:MAG TPA: hypothetical protein VGR62_04485 [Candidatus Binatia bacterium]|jgi:hypothetical protein|nr:hypothetical protein [Candidatus Binatia bacterium]